MTHHSVIALICSITHVKMLEKVIFSEPKLLKSSQGRFAFLYHAREIARKYEAELGETKKLLSSRFQKLIDNFENLSSNSQLLVASNGGECFVPDTLTMCYGLLAADFSFKAAQRAVLIGGDTDSNAGIVGSTVALIEPTTHIAKPLRDQIWRKAEINSISQNFAQVLINKTP